MSSLETTGAEKMTENVFTLSVDPKNQITTVNIGTLNIGLLFQSRYGLESNHATHRSKKLKCLQKYARANCIETLRCVFNSSLFLDYINPIFGTPFFTLVIWFCEGYGSSSVSAEFTFEMVN